VLNIYENPAEYPAIYGGDECGAGVRGMQSPSLPFIMPRFLKRGSLLSLILMKQEDVSIKKMRKEKA
jgi:hypothetical protein